MFKTYLNVKINNLSNIKHLQNAEHMHSVNHSDFLIHWTGKDIDNKHDPDWYHRPYCEIKNNDLIEEYIQRLVSILKYGLWMTKDEELILDGQKINRPLVARTCFTELKLSDSRAHAVKFGRLGIGVKRFFLFDRLGCPMIYVQPEMQNLFLPKANKNLPNQNYYQWMLLFAKEMFERDDRGHIRYDIFDESEWRIVFSEEIKTTMNEAIKNRVIKKRPEEMFLKPDNLPGENKPEYLLPLDGWFSMVIFPSLEIKNRALENTEIINLINDIKKADTPGCTKNERVNLPILLDLDACKHF